MTNVQRTHQYSVGQTCTFTNLGSSGVTSNDGKRCEITRLKPVPEWAGDEAEYVIEIEGGGGFGVRESELEPVP